MVSETIACQFDLLMLVRTRTPVQRLTGRVDGTRVGSSSDRGMDPPRSATREDRLYSRLARLSVSTGSHFGKPDCTSFSARVCFPYLPSIGLLVDYLSPDSSVISRPAIHAGMFLIRIFLCTNPSTRPFVVYCCFCDDFPELGHEE